MGIDRFDTRRFESALPAEMSWDFNGFESGERVYRIDVNEFARIMIRSSIDDTGYAAESGEDSIRMWLEVLAENGEYRPVKKLDTWTTRVPGWEKRVSEKLWELYRYGNKVARAIPLKNGKPQAFWFVKNGKNTGRPCSKDIKNNSGFTWMDEPVEEAKETLSTPVTEKVDSELTENQSLEDLFKEVDAIAEEQFKKKVEPDKKPNGQQVAAIMAPIDKPIRVIAAAGSGKTFVVERRYQYLLENGFMPDDIVVVTLTKSMSQDMADRIIGLNPSIIGTQGETQICTIHAFCNRVLSAAGMGRRIPKNWEVKKILQDMAKELWPYVQESDKSTCRPTWEELANAISNVKYRYLQPGEDYGWFEAMWGRYHAERLEKVRSRFDQIMRSKNWWTFADMLYEMEHSLITNISFRESVQGKFKYVMIDEGQDTNAQAMRILTMVAQPENQIFIVGDPDQLLFRFAGATPEINLQEGFSERYKNGMTFFLETNYRSTREIVEASNQLISKNYRKFGGPYSDELRKRCEAAEWAEPGKFLDYTMYIDAQDEAEGIAESIVEMINNGVQPNEIFVASRTRAQLAYLEPPLTKFGVPFINITGGSFWLLRHVQYILSYMRLAINGNDAESFRRIYNVASNQMLDRYGDYCPTRWLGNSFLREVNKVYDPQKVRRAAYSYRGWRDGINDLVFTMDNVTRLVNEAPPKEVVRWIIDNVVAKYLRHEDGIGDNDDIGKLADLEAVADIAGKFDSIEAFFERIDRAIMAAMDAKNKNWNKYVVLSTVHRLKGMERDIVFGIGWCEGQKINKSGVPQPVGLLPHTYSLIEPPQNGPLSIKGKNRLEDERCIGYVLVTRAKKEVHLSGFQNHLGATMERSRFIYELGDYVALD